METWRPGAGVHGSRMTTIQLALYVAAVIVLLIGAVIDDPRFSVTRCIALALALVIAAQTMTGK